MLHSVPFTLAATPTRVSIAVVLLCPLSPRTTRGISCRAKHAVGSTELELASQRGRVCRELLGALDEGGAEADLPQARVDVSMRDAQRRLMARALLRHDCSVRDLVRD